MRKKFVFVLVLILIASSSTTFLPAKAESSRTIIVPDDYPTINTAIANANQGDTIFVKQGTYNEKVWNITQPLQIRGQSPNNTRIILHPEIIFGGYISVVPSYYYQTSIAISANNVELSGFTISCEEISSPPPDLASRSLGNSYPPYEIGGGGGVILSGNHENITGNIINTSLLIEGYNSTISENTLANGIVDCPGSNNQIISNSIINSQGIAIGGNSNLISTNNVTGTNKKNTGILTTGDSNTFAHNNVTDWDYALVMYRILNGVCSNNLFFENTFTYNVYGMWVSGGDNNIFYRNNFLNNSIAVKTVASVYVEGVATDVTFYQNSFIGNVIQLSIVTGPIHLDYNKTGNYWSDYFTRYPDAVEIDDSGIGNKPYIIDANNIDRYPLIYPFSNSPPKILLLLPVNQTFSNSTVSLAFSADKEVNWTGYSLDGRQNVTILGNTTLTELSNGVHNITIYANDTFGNMRASQTVNFTIAKQEPFPIVTVATASGVIAFIVAAGLLVYRKNYKTKATQP